MKWTGNRFCWGDPKCSTYTTYSAVASTRSGLPSIITLGGQN